MKKILGNKKGNCKYLSKLSISFILLLIVFFLANEYIKGSSYVVSAHDTTRYRCQYTMKDSVKQPKIETRNIYESMDLSDTKENNDILLDKPNEKEGFCYLSDIEYIKEQSSVAYRNILLDKNMDTNHNNGLITLNINGKKTSFLKGILAHATSTIVYDISEYNYDYFTSYIGLDESQLDKGNGVKFYIYTSNDGQTWELKTSQKPVVLKGTSDAIFIKIDIKGAKYLKLYCNNNGNISSDHAVYADAKLIKEDYIKNSVSTDFIKTVEEYDEILKKYEGKELIGKYELTLLQREFVNNVGYNELQMFTKHSNEHRETIFWLMNDIENLHLYIIGGKPDGTYIDSLKILNELYHTYKCDLDNKEVTNYGTIYGKLYKKMMVTLSLTHSTQVALWMDTSKEENQSDAVTRYTIYKQLHADGKFMVSSRQNHTEWFESLSVEEMRYVLNNIIDDEEILWLNEYTQKYINENPRKEEEYLQPHHYIKYIWPDYTRTEYYLEENKNIWDEKYGFLKYGVSYKEDVPKLWMNIESGAVCGGISKFGSNIRAVHGTPSSVISQPGHVAIIYYRKNSEGKGYWTIDNNISGWAQSGKLEKLLTRMPLGWGDGDYVSEWSASYIILAQDALNDYENYEKSEEMIMLANVYKDNQKKQEELYRKAIEIQPINIDAWYGLINMYKTDTTRTEEDFYKLAQELTQAIKYYPLPMYDLLNLIKENFTSDEYSYNFNILQINVLTEASELTSTQEILQPSATNEVAKYILQQIDTMPATFSFDGENANRIVLSSRYKDSRVRLDYSIDGKQTWNEIEFSENEEQKVCLTEEEIQNISAEKDIYIYINNETENVFKIDILKPDTPKLIYNDNLENKIIGVTKEMEWAIDGCNTWTSFKDEQPDLTQNKIVKVRKGKTGVYLASDEVILKYDTSVSKPDIGINNTTNNNLNNSNNNIETNYGSNNIENDNKVIEENEKYKIEDGCISRIVPGTTVSKLKQDLKLNKEVMVSDKTRNSVQEDAIIKTGMVLTINSNLQYTLVVTGDINGDGKVSIIDLAKVKLHYIETNILSGFNEKSSDINGDGKISINDIARLKSVLIELTQIRVTE